MLQLFEKKALFLRHCVYVHIKVSFPVTGPVWPTGWVEV